MQINSLHKGNLKRKEENIVMLKIILKIIAIVVDLILLVLEIFDLWHE